MQTFTLNDVYEPMSKALGRCESCNTKVYTDEEALIYNEDVYCSETCVIAALECEGVLERK